MSRWTKLAAVTAAVAGLTVGPGCGMFDECDDCDQTQTTKYPRHDGEVQIPPPPPGPSLPPGAGIHTEGDRR
jgi:hypothetical protein